tara:strand:- start:183 stop:359 length:177 start_codon:yes stop_codon:yes gene_type:complete
MSEENLVEKVRELEMALCQANGKLNAVRNACERVMTEGSSSSPCAQTAKKIADYLKEE